MKTKLVNMIMPAPKVDVLSSAHPLEESTGAYYPWGLELTLKDEEIKKLGLDVKSLNIDGMLRIEAEAKVVSMDISQTLNSEKKPRTQQNVRLQITRMSASPENSETPEDSFRQAAENMT
jgi:hypothetical protein